MSNHKKKELNYQICLLQTIAIIMVVMGHTEKSGHTALSILNWAPIYSCHLPIFLFISGYLYRADHDRSPVNFIWKKIKTLLLPYYAINGLFLLIQTLMNKGDFNLGSDFSFSNWILQPWKTTQPLTFAIPSWFIFALFLAYIIFCLARTLLSFIIKNELIRDTFFLVLTICIGVLSVHYINLNDAPEIQVVYLRSVIMIPFIQLGFMYKKYLEEMDTLNNILYFSILFVIQLVLILTIKEPSLRFGLYGIKDFVNAGIPFYIAGVTGTAFWLRITRILASGKGNSRIITYIGQNTKHIMMFHLFGFFLLNSLINAIYKTVDISRIIYSFNTDTFHSSFYYTAADNPRATVFYLIFGIGFSIIISLLINWVKRVIRTKLSSKSTADNLQN